MVDNFVETDRRQSRPAVVLTLCLPSHNGVLLGGTCLLLRRVSNNHEDDSAMYTIAGDYIASYADGVPTESLLEPA
jgi:hypothetical protein